MPPVVTAAHKLSAASPPASDATRPLTTESVSSQSQSEGAPEAREIEDAQWRDDVSKMSASEAFGAHLNSKLTTDIVALRAQLADERQAVEKTEAELTELDRNLAAKRESSTALLSQLQSELKGLSVAAALVGEFQGQSAALARDVKGATELSEQEKRDAGSIKSRIEQEAAINSHHIAIILAIKSSP